MEKLNKPKSKSEHRDAKQIDINFEEESMKVFLKNLVDEYHLIDLGVIEIKDNKYLVDGKEMTERELKSHAFNLNQKILNELYKGKDPGDITYGRI